MQTRLKTVLWISAIILVLLICVGGVLTVRALNGYPLIISDASYKTLSYSGNNFVLNNYVSFLNLLKGRFGGFTLLLFQLLEGLVIFVSVYFILEKLRIKERAKIVTFIFLCINPVMVWSLLVINFPIFIFMLFSLITLLFLHKWYLGLLFSLLLLPIDLFSFITILTFFSVYKNKKKFYFTFNVILVSLLFMLKPTFLHNFIFEFGVLNGYSFVFFLIAFIGLFSLQKGINKGYYVLLLILFTKELFSGFEILLTIPLLIFSAGAIESLWQHKWSNHLLKVMSIALLFLTLLFPFTVALQKLANNPLDGNGYSSLMELRKMPPGNVLSSKDSGFTIHYLANKSEVWDSETRNKSIINMTQHIFTARSIKKVKVLLRDLNVNYIWITPKIKENFKDELVFLLRDNQTFQLKNGNDGYEIWEVFLK